MPLKSNLLEIAAAIPAAIDRGAGKTAGQVKETRDGLVHVVSGELLASGRVVQVAEGHYQVREGDGLPDARAIYEEYGSAMRPAHPHMTPAAEQHRDDLSKNIAAEIEAVVKGNRV